MTEPCWWVPSPTDISYSNLCPKRKREPTTPTRSGPLSNPAGAPAGPSSHPPGATWGFSEPMHVVRTSVPLPTPAGPTILGPAQSSHSSMGPMDSDPDPTRGWSGVPITTKLTQGQKRALKVKQQAELGIPQRGFGRGSSSNQFMVITMSS